MGTIGSDRCPNEAVGGSRYCRVCNLSRQAKVDDTDRFARSCAAVIVFGLLLFLLLFWLASRGPR